MSCRKTILLIIAVITLCGGCINTRYITDRKSVARQHDMSANRIGTNLGNACINMAVIFASAILGIPYEPEAKERKFKQVSIVNESADSLYVNMVTDIVWKEDGYCDIMGIVLPPEAKQKLLLPYPAAYNVYFRTPFTEEEKLEIRTDNKHRRIKLKTGMTKFNPLKGLKD